MLDSEVPPPHSSAEGDCSRFTYRDLRDLSRFVTTCPLRVIALIDFDAFYAQCESVRLGIPNDQPLAVLQFKNCIALNYAAKAAGLKRGVGPEDAKKQCPSVIIQHVATWREGDSTWAYRPDVKQDMETDKAALDPYRLQSRKAFDLIKSMLPGPPVQKVEKASIDEVFLDLSAQVYARLIDEYPYLATGLQQNHLDSRLPLPGTSVLDWKDAKLIAADVDAEQGVPDWDDIVLCVGSDIVAQVRQQVYTLMKYSCSAGIAGNKVVAKLAAGHNKPNQQTVVRRRAVSAFLSEYKLSKIRGLGGKLGNKVVTSFGTEQIAELLDITLKQLQSVLGAGSGSWVFNVIRGIEYSEVVERTQLQSMLAQKTFAPKAEDLAQAEKWLTIFAGDLMGRLEEQDAASSSRRPRVIALHHAINGRYGPKHSKQMHIPTGARITQQLLFDLSRSLLVQISLEGPAFPCLELSVSLSNFEDVSSGNSSLRNFFIPSAGKEVVVTSHAQPVAGKRKREVSEYFARPPSSNKKTLSGANGVVDSGAGEDADSLPAEASSTSDSGQELYCCPKCKKKIPSTGVLEHLDWHVAKELQDC
ncbi:N-acetyltransferase eso1 [Lithohypha guttulata]|nr:N-acetyltransferase eso1 [Lithohypha guttulata]